MTRPMCFRSRTSHVRCTRWGRLGEVGGGRLEVEEVGGGGLEEEEKEGVRWELRWEA